jgi:hypothetical protein
LYLSSKPARPGQFLTGNPGFAPRHVNRSSGVVCMQMCEHDLAHISGGDPESPELGAELLIGVDGERTARR